MGEIRGQFTWNGIDLDALRHVMDEPADQAVLSLYESKSMHHLRALLTDMAENDSAVPEELPTIMHDFVKDELEFQFSDYDIEMFKKSHHIWKEKGMKFCFVLFFRSLPYTYMAEKPANVLRMTKLLIEQPERRVFETAQFVFDVMDENWWEPDKRGILTALKVRIMHASMRHIILDKDGGEKWDEEWGMPISQEDLVATNQTFSLEFFKGIEYLGDSLSEEEQIAWFHTWKRIGQLMGVQDNLLCKDIEEAWSLQDAIYNHLFHDENYSGVTLSKALVETMAHFMLTPKFVLLLMRKMLADDKYPECFNKMLEPTYGKLYPEVFHKPETAEEKAKHDELLRSHFHEHLKEYHGKVSEHRQKQKASMPKLSLKARFISLFIRKPKRRRHLLDLHLDIFHNLLHHEDGETPVDRLEEEMIKTAMSAIGGIMVSVLSVYFRDGKKTGFRIPDNLKDHWALE